MNRLWLLPLLLLTSACSTILDESTQEVRFETPGAFNSSCQLDTGEVSYKIFPPEDIIIMKTDEELEVRCLADGNREKTVMIRPVLSNNTFLNMGNGFVPGFALDEHTNAHYIYPDVIVIDFTNIPYKKAHQPTYSLNPAAPDVQDIDPKRGGMPAIHSSDLDNPPVPSERPTRTYYTDTPESIEYQKTKPEPIK